MLSFNYDDKVFATPYKDNDIMVWSLPTLKELKLLKGHTDNTRAV